MKLAESLGYGHDLAKKIKEADLNCLGCTLGKGRITSPKTSHEEHYSKATHFNDRISADYIIAFGPWHVIVWMDDFSRYVRVECIKHRDQPTTLTSFKTKWEADFHIPRRFRHDVDQGFNKLDAYLQENGCIKEDLPPYAPELNGQNERVHQTLMAAFTSVMAHSELPMTPAIRRLVFENHIVNIYNNTKHSATQEAPVWLATQQQPSLELAITYYPGRPVVFNPDPEAYKHNPETRHVKGRPFWREARCVTQQHSNLVTVIDKNQKLWHLPVGRIKLADPFAAKVQAATDRLPAHKLPPWKTNITVDKPSGAEHGRNHESDTDDASEPANGQGQEAGADDEQPNSDERQQGPTTSEEEASDKESELVEPANPDPDPSESSDEEVPEAPPPRRSKRPAQRVEHYDASSYLTYAEAIFSEKLAMDHQPEFFNLSYTYDDNLALGATVVSAKDVPSDEKKQADQREIEGWKKLKVYTPVPIAKAREECKKGNGAFIDTRFVYALKNPSPEYPNGLWKSRCVARGFRDQRQNVDSNSPAASGDSRRIFIAVAFALKLSVVIADIKQAYLNANLLGEAKVYLIPPRGYDSGNEVWRLNKAVYGLADAGVAWYECISSKMISQGWKRSMMDPCIFTKGLMIAVLYVDDLLVAAPSDADGMKAIESLGYQLGRGRPLLSGDEFAGVTLQFKGSFNMSPTVTLTQQTYSEKTVPEPIWTRSTPTPMPVTLVPLDTKESLLNEREHKKYRSIIGKIMWLATSTRPDIAYAAAFLSRKLAGPNTQDFQYADRLAAYIKQTASLAVTYHRMDASKLQLTVVHDASHAAPRDEYRSQAGYLIMLHDQSHSSLVSWKSSTLKKKAASSMAAECFSAQVAWQHGQYLRDLLKDLSPVFTKLHLSFTTDNDDLYKTVKIRKRSLPKDRSLTLCVAILRESADDETVTVKFIPGLDNPSDALTKPLHAPQMQSLMKIMEGNGVNYLGLDFDPLSSKRDKRMGAKEVKVPLKVDKVGR